MADDRTAASILARAAVALVAALALLGRAAPLAAGERVAVAVIVNAAGPLADATEAQLRDVFLGRLRLVAGVRVKPVQVEGPARVALLRALLGMSERDFQLYWLRKAYDDAVLPPPVMAGAAEVLAHVRLEKGGVGFVEKANLERTDRVKVVYEVDAALGH